MNDNLSISSLRKNDKSVLVDWSDGKKSKFNFLWLRDNCPSEVHPTARERTFNLLTVTDNIHPKSYKVNDKGQLEIEWSEGEHTSYYDIDWLRHNCYTLKSKKNIVHHIFCGIIALNLNLMISKLNMKKLLVEMKE